MPQHDGLLAVGTGRALRRWGLVSLALALAAPKQFDFIYAYSPYQHVKPGTEYPAILFMTADTDTRISAGKHDDSIR